MGMWVGGGRVGDVPLSFQQLGWCSWCSSMREGMDAGLGRLEVGQQLDETGWVGAHKPQPSNNGLGEAEGCPHACNNRTCLRSRSSYRQLVHSANTAVGSPCDTATLQLLGTPVRRRQ